MMQENEKYKLILDKKKQEEREVEKRRIEQYSAAEEQQEKRKYEEMKAKEARIQALIKYAEEHVGKNEFIKRKAEEQKFLKELLEKEKKEEIEEVKRKKMHREKELKARRFLDEQMKEKALKVSEAEKRSRELVETWRLDDESFRKEQREKAGEVKKKNMAWADTIMRQIGDAKVKRRQQRLMDEREYQINKKLIEGVPPQNEGEANERNAGEEKKLSS